MMAHRQGFNAPQRRYIPAVMQNGLPVYTIFVIKKSPLFKARAKLNLTLALGSLFFD